MINDNSISITVYKARNIDHKSNSNVYAEIVLSDEKGTKIGRAQETKSDKRAEPTWDSSHSFNIQGRTGNYSIKVAVWEQHTFSRDKYLGEVNFIFYPAKSKTVESWFSLQSKKSKAKAKGEVRVKVEYNGKVPDEGKSTTSNNNTSNTNAVQDRSVLSNTLIDEPFTVVNSKVIEWESFRDGPPEVEMEKFPTASKANIVNKVDVDNNYGYYSMEAAKANCKITGGKWYYEVTLLSSGRIYIGWCTTDYDPRSHTTGDAWSFDGYSNYKRRKDQSTVYGSEYWTTNDTIGCSFDYDKKSIHFYKNGKDIGEAFGVSDLPKKQELMPFIDLAGYMRVKMNFGATPFKFPQSGFNSLHLKLNKTQLAKVESRFQHYNKVTIEAGNEDENIIREAGIDKLQKDLGIESDTDIGFLVLAWKLKCQEAWEISLEEWMNGCLMYGCEGMTAIKNQIAKWKVELEDEKQYKEFYFWLFPYFKKENNKFIPLEEATLLWNIVLRERKVAGQKWKYFDQWLEYLEKAKVSSINANIWEMLWSFMNKYPKDVSAYQEDQTCYPVVFDKFVDYVNGDNVGGEDDDDDDDL